ncbi:MAG: NAD(P)-binding protein [Thermoplasmata archaeon]|nr:NAD(P)-binding protein [Thermoplasmata archaeon]
MKNDNQRTIKILGAGLSGLSAATPLAKNGMKVEIYEKSTHVGGRFIHDFQCLRNYGNIDKDPFEEFKEIGICIQPYKKIMKIVRHSPSHSFMITSKNKPICYLVLRGKNKNSIDSQLRNLALNHGTTIHYNTTSDIKNVDIVATGPSKADSVAYGEIYEDTTIDDTIHVFLDNNNSPGGYLYVLPGEKKGEVEVINGISYPSTSRHTIQQLYHQTISKNVILKDLLDGATKTSIQGGIGCFTLLDEPYTNKRYYVGEAAGLQDAIAGFGVRYAILSGYVAACSILTGENYNQCIANTFKTQLEFERKRSEKFKRMTNKEIDKLFECINNKFGPELTIYEYESLRGDI